MDRTNLIRFPQKSNIRSTQEVDAEVSRLYQFIDKVPARSAFGDDNQEAIKAQIEVIAKRMTLEQVTTQYKDAGDYILSAAWDAERWLREHDEPTSKGWSELVG